MSRLAWYLERLAKELGYRMKENLHPKYVEAHVQCACGNKFVTRSIKPQIQVEICSQCHPFFTGKQKLMDTAGRIEKFKKKYAQK